MTAGAISQRALNWHGAMLAVGQRRSHHLQLQQCTMGGTTTFSATGAVVATTGATTAGASGGGFSICGGGVGSIGAAAAFGARLIQGNRSVNARTHMNMAISDLN